MLSILPQPNISSLVLQLFITIRKKRQYTCHLVMHIYVHVVNSHILTDSENIIAGTEQNNAYQHPPIP